MATAANKNPEFKVKVRNALFEASVVTLNVPKELVRLPPLDPVIRPALTKSISSGRTPESPPLAFATAVMLAGFWLGVANSPRSVMMLALADNVSAPIRAATAERYFNDFMLVPVC